MQTIAVREGDAPGYGASPQRLSDRVRATIRARHYSRRTEQAYLHWIRRFWMFTGRRDPAHLGADEVRAFLEMLAVEERVARSADSALHLRQQSA